MVSLQRIKNALVVMVFGADNATDGGGKVEKGRSAAERSLFQRVVNMFFDWDDMDYVANDEGKEWQVGMTPVQPFSWVHVIRSHIIERQKTKRARAQTRKRTADTDGYASGSLRVQYKVNLDDLYARFQPSFPRPRKNRARERQRQTVLSNRGNMQETRSVISTVAREEEEEEEKNEEETPSVAEKEAAPEAPVVGRPTTLSLVAMTEYDSFSTDILIEEAETRV